MQKWQQSDSSQEISLYRDDPADASDIAHGVQLLKYAFPEIAQGFTVILIDRILANRFTKQRLQDAIGKVIDSFQYKDIKIADIISFDRKVKTYSYTEMCALCPPRTTDNFSQVEINGKKRWIER